MSILLIGLAVLVLWFVLGLLLALWLGPMIGAMSRCYPLHVEPKCSKDLAIIEASLAA